MKLSEALPGSIVVMVDPIEAKKIIREVWYERLDDSVTTRRCRDQEGNIRYPQNVPIRRVRVLQYEIYDGKEHLRWDTGFNADAAIWECDGRISVVNVTESRFPL